MAGAKAEAELVVNQTMPAFLSRLSFPNSSGMVELLKDATSDMAAIARKGSALVNHIVERQNLGSQIVAHLLDPSELLNQKDIKQPEEESNAAGTAPHSLPISAKRDELMQLIRQNQVVVLIGETASGKTTQLPQYLHQEGYTNSAMVGCTQPRRAAVVSAATRVSREMGTPLGDKVGYAIRFEDVTGPNTLLKYMTDGVLLREALKDPYLNNYSVIILDQAHERSVNTDTLFGLLKTVLRRRPDFRLVVTSATPDAQKFSSFFGGSPIFEIPARPYKVNTLYEKSHPEDYVAAAVKKAQEIHLGYPTPGDILMFLTGQEEIEAASRALTECMEQYMVSDTKPAKAIPKLLILPVYSQLPADLQLKTFQTAEDGVRKCIIAIDIVEKSLNLEGISYVIDAGYGKINVYNAQMGVDSQRVFPISRAEADERAGRAGRTGPGVCYRLYPESAFWNEMLPNPVPEIQSTNLCNVILLLKSLHINLDEFEFMDSPSQDSITNSMHMLWMLGALDDDGSLTKLGRKMAEFPLDATLAKMVLMGEQLGCTDEVLTIVSMLSVPSVFFRPKEKAEEADAAREKFFIPKSDHLTLLNIYKKWQWHEYQSEWCNEHFLHVKELRKAREVRSQLLQVVDRLNIPLVSHGYDWEVVRKAICSAYCQNASKLKGIKEYLNCRVGTPCHLHPNSSLHSSGCPPEYVVYHELILGTATYMQCTTAVEPHWLVELAPSLFSIKEKDASASSNK